jgi:triacylglycerol lipase
MKLRTLYFNAVLASLGTFAIMVNPVSAQTSSPFQPPEEKLGVYVTNSGPGLDSGCTFRSGGPLIINIDVPKVVNDSQINPDGTLKNPNELVQRGIIAQKAIVNFPVFDIDSGASVSPPDQPEVDVVSFNGERKDTLTGSNNQWTNDPIEVDIRELKFGQANELKIDIDVDNPDELWCMAVDWVSVEFDVAIPYVLAHGINTTGPDTWSEDITRQLDAYGIKYTFDSVGRNGSVGDNAVELRNIITPFLEELKSDKVHIIAHSKGGLDSQALQALGPDFTIRSLSTLSTPHLGTVVADINIIQLLGSDRLQNSSVDPNGFIDSLLRATPWAGSFSDVPERPGLDDLTTQAASTALLLRQRGNISPTFAYGGNADINGDGELQSAERQFVRADIPWNVMRNFTQARVVNTFTEPGFLGFGTRTVIEFVASPSAAPLANDVVVTTNSALPSYANSLGVVRRNHSSIVDYALIEDFLDRTVNLR